MWPVLSLLAWTSVADEPEVEQVPERADKSESSWVDRRRLDVYHHFPDGIPLSIDLSTLNLGPLAIDVTGAVNVTVIQPTPSAPVATRAVLIIKSITGGTNNMPGQITVDTVNEIVSIQWVDDKGDTDATGPVGAVVTYASDNPAAATIDPTSGAFSLLTEGSGNATATIANADGTPVLEADGVTPFPTPAPAPFTVGPGAAVGEALALSV